MTWFFIGVPVVLLLAHRVNKRAELRAADEADPTGHMRAVVVCLRKGDLDSALRVLALWRELPCDYKTVLLQNATEQEITCSQGP